MTANSGTHGGLEGLMAGFGQWLERYLVPPLVAFGNQRHFVAIRAGLIRVIPIIIVGAIPLVLTNLPVESWAQAMAPYADVLNLLFQMTFGFLGLWVAISVGAEMGRIYKLDVTMMSVVTTVSFILAVAPVNMADGTLPYAYFGATGMFTAFVVAIICAEVTRLMRDHGLVIRMPSGVPENIAASFSALFPLFVLLFGFWFTRHVLNFELATAIATIIQPLVVVADSWIAVTVAMLITQLLWFVGIHGGSITIWGVLYPLLLANIAANAEAQAAGQPLPHIFTEPFNFIYGMPSGVGITLPLVLFFIFAARSERLKAIGKMSIGPGIFNINEPVTFGTPIIMNPLLFIPFVLLTSTLGYVIGYAATAWGLVSATFVQVPWTTPPLVNAYLATGGDVRSVVLQAGILVLSGLVWYPFFRIWDRRLLVEERGVQGRTEEAMSRSEDRQPEASPA